MDLSLGLRLGGSSGPTLPSGAIMRIEKNAAGNWVDTIGLLVSDYASLSAHWQSVFFTNPTTPKQAATADIIADPLINIPGGNVFYSAAKGILAIYGTSPVEQAERRLWRCMFRTHFEPLCVDGEAVLVDNNPLYIEV